MDYSRAHGCIQGAFILRLKKSDIKWRVARKQASVKRANMAQHVTVSTIVKGTEYGIDHLGRAFARPLGCDTPVTGPAAYEQALALLDTVRLHPQEADALRGIFQIRDEPFHYILSDPRAQPPRRAHPSDAGYDLVIIDIAKKVMPEAGRLWSGSGGSWAMRTLSDCVEWLTKRITHWLPGHVVLYETGVAVQPPHGYYFELVPRSSIVKSGYMLANSVGVIDASYQGTIKVPLVRWCWWAREPQLPARLVQLVLRRQHYITGARVETFGHQTARGAGGFGSSGCK